MLIAWDKGHYSLTLSIALGNCKNLENHYDFTDGECFPAGLLSSLYRCCTKIEFYSADSCVLQSFDSNWTLNKLPRACVDLLYKRKNCPLYYITSNGSFPCKRKGLISLVFSEVTSISGTSKTRVKILILSLTRPHAISYKYRWK